MSQRDRDRLLVIRQVAAGELTVVRASELLDLCREQVARIRDRYRAEGDRALIHRGRGRRANNAKPAEWREKILERAAEPQFHDFRPTLLAEHLSRDPEIGPVNPYTLRRWLIEEGRWVVRKRGARHRRARLRRAALGELVQWDSSEHAWLEDRYPGKLVLVTLIDDATSRVQYARFAPRDNGPVNCAAVIGYLRRHGRPVAFYADQASHFVQWTRSAGRGPKEEREPQQTESVIRRGLKALNVELIRSLSPQGKGRIERGFGTAQDRLIKEMRVQGICTLETANQFLEQAWIPFWNQRFAVDPADPKDRHRPLPKRLCLEAVFSETCTRVVANDFTLRYRNQRFQIEKREAKGIRPGEKIIVESRLDGSTHFRWRSRYLHPELIHSYKAEPIHVTRPGYRRPKPSKPRANRTTPRPAPPRPAPDHPWRTSRIGRGPRDFTPGKVKVNSP